VSDRPPVAVEGESALALLSQDTLQAGYRAIGAQEYYQPITGRLAGLTPFSSAAATVPMLDDEHVSVAVLISHFVWRQRSCPRRRARQCLPDWGNERPAAQAALRAVHQEALIGKSSLPHLFPAARCRLQPRGPGHPALTVILGLLIGAILKVFGWSNATALVFAVVSACDTGGLPCGAAEDVQSIPWLGDHPGRHGDDSGCI
jgi:hypothetical protein